jgi:hypothetical protein
MLRSIPNKLLYFLLLVCAIELNSCKKENTFRDQLIATWFDGVRNYITFNSDGTGKIEVLGYPAEPITWSLQASNTQLLIICSPSYSETWQIVELSSTVFDFIQSATGTAVVDCTKT